MADRWVFGYYFNFNKNYDPSLTADLTKTRWRTQYPVPDGTVISDPQDDWLTIGLVHLVFIPDLQYFLKNTDPVGDEFWLKSVEGQRRVDTIYLAGGSSVRETFTVAAQYFINTTNSTNPNAAAFARPNPTPKATEPVGYLSFSESKLELGFDYGAVGGMSYAVEILKMADDAIEQRNANLHLPKGRWQLGDRLIAESQADALTEVSYLKQFHLDRLGSFQGFRFKDWSDFEGFNENIATGDGVANQFQLRKVYTVAGSSAYRPIQKPVAGSVSISVDGIEQTQDWSIDHATGIISKFSPVADGALIRASFKFDVPVYFESDQISFSLQGYEDGTGDEAAFGWEASHPKRAVAIYRLESVFVVEQKIPLLLPWKIGSPQVIEDVLDLGIIYETIETSAFLTEKQELKNGYSARISKSAFASRKSFNLGSKTYDLSQVNRLLDFFWNARGSLNTFSFLNGGISYRVRFDQSEVNFKFEAANQGDRFFSLAGLKLIAFNDIG